MLPSACSAATVGGGDGLPVEDRTLDWPGVSPKTRAADGVGDGLTLHDGDELGLHDGDGDGVGDEVGVLPNTLTVIGITWLSPPATATVSVPA